MLKLTENAIEKIADNIVDYIKSQGKSLYKTPKAGGGSNEKNRLKQKWDRVLKPLELDFRKGIVVLFKQQKAKVIATLQGRRKSLEKGIKDDAKKAAAIPVSSGEVKKLKEYTMPKITHIVETAGNIALAELEVTVACDVLSPHVVDWLKEHAAEAVTGIGETTQKALNKTLLEGIENGESIKKLTERVKAEYKNLELEEWRAKRIAMQETKSASGRGNFEGIKQSGLTGKKGILLGPRPCPLCLDFEGRGLIDLNDTWGGFDCPTFHIGCMCDMYFVPDEKAGVGEFVPAGSIGEAEKYAEKLVSGKSEIGGAKFGKVSLDNANIINKRLTDLIKDYNIKPDFIGSNQSWKKLWKDKIPGIKMYPINKNTYAQTVSMRLPDESILRGIAFNERYFKKEAKLLLKKSLEDSFVTGFHKLKNIEHIADHEYAHILDYARNIHVQGKFVEEYQFLKERGLIKTMISGYAEGDGMTESWAELFALYRADKLPPLRKKLVEELLSTL